jgi:hypothetical protein
MSRTILALAAAAIIAAALAPTSASARGDFARAGSDVKLHTQLKFKSTSDYKLRANCHRIRKSYIQSKLPNEKPVEYITVCN